MSCRDRAARVSRPERDRVVTGTGLVKHGVAAQRDDGRVTAMMSPAWRAKVIRSCDTFALYAPHGGP